MSDNQNRGLRDFSEYDSMTTEELEEILRLDAETPVGQDSDEELLFYVMGVLADRRNNTEVTGKTALEAYESFKQHYLPEEEKIDSAPAVKARKARRPIRWLHSMAAAAAVLVIVFGSVTIDAMGFNIWETVVTWAQETFHFGDGEQTGTDIPTPSDTGSYTSLQDVLVDTAGVENIIPTWIPDGYRLTDIDIVENPMRKKYVAVYQYEEKCLKIIVQLFLDSYPEQIEQSDGFVETYESENITYYLFSNYDQTKAAWINDTYECCISGELTLDQIKTMIDSIEEG